MLLKHSLDVRVDIVHIGVEGQLVVIDIAVTCSSSQVVVVYV